MSLYCEDGMLASMLDPVPSRKPERGAPWRPPDTSSTTCQRCGRPGWQHRSFPPVLADEVDRAIYAAAFVAAVLRMDAHDAIADAERIVDLHRRTRLGT